MKILLADDDAERARQLLATLARDPAIRVIRAPAGELLADAVLTHAPDVVLVDMARPDRDTLDGVRALTDRNPLAVVLFVDEDDPAFMEEAIAAGVCSYNVGALAPASVRPVLRAAVALFRQIQAARTARDAAEARLDERRLLDRAKSLLIRQRQLTENEAHRWLQRQAMASGRRLHEVARDLLAGRAGKDTP